MKRIPPFCFLLFCLTNLIAQSPPIIHCKDTIFSVNEFNINNPNGVCEGNVKLQATADTTSGCNDDKLFWVVFIDLWGNGSIDLEFTSFLPEVDTSLANDTNGNGIPDRHIPVTLSGETIFIPSFTLDAELSLHKVSWRATNACGFFAQCSSHFSVQDKTPPVTKGPPIDSVLKEYVTYDSEIWAKSYDRGSNDNCSPQQNLLYTFNNEMPVWQYVNVDHYFKGDGILATAAEHNAGIAQRWVPSKRSSTIYPTCEIMHCFNPYIQKISVFDQSKNYSTFEVPVSYFDIMSFCDPSRIKLKFESPTKNATIKSLGYKYQFGEYRYGYLSDGNIVNALFLPYCEDTICMYIIKYDDTNNGINHSDFIILRDHLLGLKKIINPYQLIAADVNGDGSINAADFVLLRRKYFGLSPFDKEKSWIFIREDENVVIQDDKILYEKLNPCFLNPQTGDFNLNFIAIKRGDIDGSYVEKI